MISGIYCLINTVNGKRYIGQSRNVGNRKKQHLYLLRKGGHYNDHLQNSFDEYGIDFFDFQILEECLPEMLDIREQVWISYHLSSQFQFGYNKESGGSFGKVMSKETRLKISLFMKGKRKGIPLSAECRRKMSLARKGKIISPKDFRSRQAQ